jgi:hypothetical protein
MPKRSAATRTSAQRKPKQKSFELVRPDTENTSTQEADDTVETTLATVSSEHSVSAAAKAASTQEAAPKAKATPNVKEFSPPQKTAEAAPQVEDIADEPASSTAVSKGSAAARLAARRQVAQKVQRTGTPMISAENYAYVRKDLIFIGILALIMFSAIIILHFVPGIGY